jgi:hypothetical protein
MPILITSTSSQVEGDRDRPPPAMTPHPFDRDRFKSAKSVAFQADASRSNRRSKPPPIWSTTVIKMLPNPALLITIQEREQRCVDRLSTPASTRRDTKSVKVENLRKSDNFKQICQIGNIPLISPDILR